MATGTEEVELVQEVSLPPFGSGRTLASGETVVSVGAAVSLVPSTEVSDGKVTLLADGWLGRVPKRLVALPPTDREPTPKSVDPEVAIPEEELSRDTEELSGG